MCGINGFNFNDEGLIQNMVETTRHRGPDDEGVYCDEHVSLGHNRLAILDTSKAGHQPMWSKKGDRVIVFNGEIYNFKELRGELERKGHAFTTQTDTEVILAGFDDEGISFFEKLNGIFAFALWDKNEHTLTLARDRYAVKPLYYYHNQGTFIFSSELKSILAHPVTRELNADALNIYFRFLYIPAPLTPWKHISKLKPGHVAVLRNGNITLSSFVTRTRIQSIDNEHDATLKVRELFDNAVERQLISDRPVGLYLSGGIDSTALLGAMKKFHTGPLNTYSVGFDVAVQSDKFNADFGIARKTALHYGTTHHETILTAKDVRDEFDSMIWHMDDLVANHTQSAMYHLSSLASHDVAVVLSGDGGDELFGGYERYYLNYLMSQFQRIPKVLRNNPFTQIMVRALGHSEVYAKMNIPRGESRFFAFMEQKQDVVKKFLTPECTQSNARNFFSFEFRDIWNHDDVAIQLLRADMRGWLPDDALLRADRMSMAHGLEQRVPFLDNDLSEYAMTLPFSFARAGRKSGKRLFKNAVRDYIPDYVFSEPKRGWFSPMSKWLRGDLQEWAWDMLSPDFHPLSKEYIDFKGVRNIFEKHISGEVYALNTLWSIITFQKWLAIYLPK